MPQTDGSLIVDAQARCQKISQMFLSLDKSIQPLVKLENGETVKASSKGTITVKTNKGVKYVQNVLFILELDQNLLSVALMLKYIYTVSFKNKFCFIKYQNDGDITKIEMQSNCFYLDLESVSEKTLIVTEVKSHLWHKRLGHCNLSSLKYRKNKNMAEDFPQILIHSHPCSSCVLGKLSKTPF